MAFSLQEVQEDVLALLDTEFVQPIVEQGIVDINTVKRNSAGRIDPYIAISFGQPREQGAKSFVGAWGHDYVLPVYAQVIASTPKVARELGNKLIRVFLGQGFDWAGEVRQMSGGPTIPITNSTQATEAYTVPMSFGLLLQLSMDA